MTGAAVAVGPLAAAAGAATAPTTIPVGPTTTSTPSTSAAPSTTTAPATTVAPLVASPNAVTGAPSSVVEGLSMTSYGNSYLTCIPPVCQRRWFERVAGRLQSPLLVNNGVGGTLTPDACTYAYGNYTMNGTRGVAPGTWKPFVGTRGGLVMLDMARNDAGWDSQTGQGGTTAKSRAGFTNGLDALIRLVRAEAKYADTVMARSSTTCGTTSGSAVISDPSCTAADSGKSVTSRFFPSGAFVGTVIPGISFRLTSSTLYQWDLHATATSSAETASIGTAAYTGQWVAQTAQSHQSDATGHYTWTNGSTVTITTPVGTDFDVILLGTDDGAVGLGGATFAITVDGAPFRPPAGTPTTCSNQQRNTAPVGNSAYTQMAIPIHGLANTMHTIVLSHADVTGRFLWYQCLLQPNPTPVTIVINKAARLASYAVYQANGAANAGWVTDQLYNGLIDTVVARFPSDQSVVVFDPNASGWDPSTMISSIDGLGVHPNDIGMACFADGIMSILNTLSARQGMISI